MASNTNITYKISPPKVAAASGTTPGRPGAPAPQKSSSWKKWVTLGSLLFLLIGGILVWVLSWPDPEVQKARDLAAKAFAPGLSPEERGQARQAFRDQYDSLTDEQKATLDAERRKKMEEFMLEREKKGAAEAHAYFSLPEDQREAFLDDKLREMQRQREERMANGGGRGGPGGPGGPGGGRGGFGGPGGPGQGGPPQRGGGETRDQRQKDRLDQIPPEQRAEMRAYRQAMGQRGQQLGIGFGGGRGGGGGGGGRPFP